MRGLSGTPSREPLWLSAGRRHVYEELSTLSFCLQRICIINWKGGCGKTTIATNLAVALAARGLATGIADYDRQKTAKSWAKLRPKNAIPVSVVDWRKDFGAHPKSLERLIIDCPPSLRAKGVRAVIAESKVVVIPLLPSLFDEMATLRFVKRVATIKSVREGNTKLLLVANRYRSDRRSGRILEDFVVANTMLLVARIPEREIYSDLARKGLTVFDCHTKTSVDQQQQWLPLIHAIEMEE
jgi:chromosome partitioning protein